MISLSVIASAAQQSIIKFRHWNWIAAFALLTRNDITIKNSVSLC